MKIAFFVSLFVLSAVRADDAAFRPLFDGKTFAGWKTNDRTAKSWKVEEGMLVLSGGNGNLISEEEFEDFELKLEWRAKKKGYNSGLFLRGNNQINLAEKSCGSLMAAPKTKGVPELMKAPGEWNLWEVTCIGNKITFKVNGKEAWNVEGFKPTKGTVGLQAEGQPIDFRNIQIRTIKK
ncbi:MAG: DUF1080 domain-containing protein [Zavarzinella sp.]